MTDETVPRRNDIQRWTLSEVMIYDAMQMVELQGADPRLTDAIVYLQKARESVANFVDGVKSVTDTNGHRRCDVPSCYEPASFHYVGKTLCHKHGSSYRGETFALPDAGFIR